MDFSHFDQRNYPTLSVEEGYGEWVATYEDTVQDEMDLRLLERLETVPWPETERAIDLACGTGRIGAWLRGQGVPRIDGVDVTPEMLEMARAKGVYEHLQVASVFDTGLPSGQYDLATQSLADEHMAEIEPLYAEAARLVRTGGRFVLVGFHPQFLMGGIPTHFNRATGDPAAIISYVHLLSDHVKAAHRAGWTLAEMDEGVIDDAWLVKKPKWEKFRNRPVSFVMVWRR